MSQSFKTANGLSWEGSQEQKLRDEDDWLFIQKPAGSTSSLNSSSLSENNITYLDNSSHLDGQITQSFLNKSGTFSDCSKNTRGDPLTGDMSFSCQGDRIPVWTPDTMTDCSDRTPFKGDITNIPFYTDENIKGSESQTGYSQAVPIHNVNSILLTDMVNTPLNQNIQSETVINLEDIWSKYLLKSPMLPKAEQISEPYGNGSLNNGPNSQKKEEYPAIPKQGTGMEFSPRQHHPITVNNMDQMYTDPSEVRVTPEIFQNWNSLERNIMSSRITNSPDTITSTSNYTVPNLLAKTEAHLVRDCNLESNGDYVFPHSNTDIYSNMVTSSTLSDADSRYNDVSHCSKQSTQKPYRQPYSPRQLETLETFYEKEPYCKHESRHYLLKITHLTDRQIRIWYQNRRAKSKKNGEVIDPIKRHNRTEREKVDFSQGTPSINENKPDISLGKERTESFSRPWFPFGLDPKQFCNVHRYQLF